jgi:peptidoglycan/xylan/chitin deacetylase (PgdA/CDA1 family)
MQRRPGLWHHLDGMVGSKQLLKSSSAAFDRLRPPPSGITILIYHRVGGGTDSDVDLPLDAFERQLAHLAERHEVIDLDEAVRRLDPEGLDVWSAPGSGHDHDERSAVVITIDDGTEDLTDTVLPALDRHGLPATAYIATRFVDEGADFPWGAPPTSWAALRDARSPLVTYASHTHDHRLLDRADPETIAEDLDRSTELLAEHLGSMPAHFAYPKALPGSPAAEVAVRRRFRTATLAGSRVNRPGQADLHRLWRTPVQCSDGFEHFVRKAAGGHRLEGELRVLGARIRHRRAVQ